LNEYVTATPAEKATAFEHAGELESPEQHFFGQGSHGIGYWWRLIPDVNLKQWTMEQRGGVA
jgi:hypothetical protein